MKWTALLMLVGIAASAGCGMHPAIKTVHEKTPEVRAYVLEHFADKLTETDRQTINGNPESLGAYVLAGDYMDARWYWTLAQGRKLTVRYEGIMNAPLDPAQINVWIREPSSPSYPTSSRVPSR